MEAKDFERTPAESWERHIAIGCELADKAADIAPYNPPRSALLYRVAEWHIDTAAAYEREIARNRRAA